jgi:peptidyl-prolyl cis-trans isomerase D
MKGGPAMNNSMNGPAPVAQSSPVVSGDILAREPLTNTAHVKHILIGWKDLGDAYGGHLDSRAAARTKADAEAKVREILAKLKAGTDFDAEMKADSEDPGSAKNGHIYEVTPDASLVIEFRQIGMRLHPGEIGVVQSDFGFHIVKRID